MWLTWIQLLCSVASEEGSESALGGLQVLLTSSKLAVAATLKVAVARVEWWCWLILWNTSGIDVAICLLLHCWWWWMHKHGWLNDTASHMALIGNMLNILLITVEQWHSCGVVWCGVGGLRVPRSTIWRPGPVKKSALVTRGYTVVLLTLFTKTVLARCHFKMPHWVMLLSNHHNV